MNHHETVVKVRFNEIDAYNVAWHGHYVTWMEVGRNGLASLFGLDAEQLHGAGYLAPVVALELKYLRPARFGDELRVRASLRPAETATLEFVCEIVGPDGKALAAGSTVHALTDLGGVLQDAFPTVVAERVARLKQWLEGT